MCCASAAVTIHVLAIQQHERLTQELDARAEASIIIDSRRPRMSEEPLTRRTFINNSLIAGEAAALAVLVGGRIVTAAEIRSAEKHKEAAPRKLGILGCGNRSKAHLAALNDVAEIQVAALCDTVPHKMALRAQLIKTGPAPRQY